MQDAYAYCAELVRTADRDRFIASLFAPAERRGALHALYAFNIEVSRVRDLAHATLPGEVRLQWWNEVIRGERAEEARANPVAAALLDTAERHGLPPARLLDLIEAHRFDLYEEPMASLTELETYGRRTASSLFALAAQILADDATTDVFEPAGVAQTVTHVLHAFPRHLARRQLYVPADLLQRHQVRLHDVFAGKSSPALTAALAELRSSARDRLKAVHDLMSTVPRQALPALLPLALVGAVLDRLERSEPFAPADIPLWRRQWLIWRAARNPARIAA